MDKVQSKLSRRNLLLVLGGAVAAVGAVALSPFRNVLARRAREAVASRSWARPASALANASYDEWVGQVGSVFTTGGGDRMRLAGVKAMPAPGERPRSLGRDSAFVAFFDPLAGRTMAGDLIYAASHPQYGPLAIFLSASVDPRAPARMVAVFN